MNTRRPLPPAVFVPLVVAVLLGCQTRRPYEGKSAAELERMLRDPDPARQVQGAFGLSRLGPEARHALWLVVLIKFAMPPVVAWPWLLPDVWAAPSPSPVWGPHEPGRYAITDTNTPFTDRTTPLSGRLTREEAVRHNKPSLAWPVRWSI